MSCASPFRKSHIPEARLTAACGRGRDEGLAPLSLGQRRHDIQACFDLVRIEAFARERAQAHCHLVVVRLDRHLAQVVVLIGRAAALPRLPTLTGGNGIVMVM